MSESVSVTYRHTRSGWEALLSTGVRLGRATTLDRARQIVRLHTGTDQLGRESVQIPDDGVDWAGLRFDLTAPTFGADDPDEAQQQRLQRCCAFYRAALPDAMRVELYGNRVLVEPGAFGLRGQIISVVNGVSGAVAHADAAPVDGTVECAQEQFRLARSVPVPSGFVRVIHELVGFEDEGALGTIHLVLK
jgi:hypothetical protein